jgi:hypothetical protein
LLGQQKSQNPYEHWLLWMGWNGVELLFGARTGHEHIRKSRVVEQFSPFQFLKYTQKYTQKIWHGSNISAKDRSPHLSSKQYGSYPAGEFASVFRATPSNDPSFGIGVGAKCDFSGVC